MNWTKKLSLWSAFVALLSVVIYAILVVGDYTISRYLAYLEEQRQSTAPQLIERQRREQEDEIQRRAAISQGFKPLLYPDAIDNYDQLKALAMRLGVAPLAPQPNSRVYYCNEGYGLVTYTTDRFGFRNANSLWDEKKIDLVLIGDSFTQGACVDKKDMIAGNVLPSSKIINLGTAGNNPLHYAALVKTFIPYIRPMKVAIIFCANDNGAGDENSIFWKQYFLEEANYFNLRNKEKISLSEPVKNFYLQAEPIIQSILNDESKVAIRPTVFGDGNIFMRAKKYLTLSNIRAQMEAEGSKTGIATTKSFFSSKLAIDTLIKVCEDSNCEPIVIYIPTSEFWRPDPRAKSYAHLLSLYAKQHKVEFLDMTKSLRSLGEEAYAVKGPHLSPKGYKLVSEKIEEILSGK
jgi:hypothetical protein